jgi:hypothetical protein
MTTRTVRATALALFLAATGCSITTPDLSGEGMVEYIDVEGGCWGIESNGEIYEPLNLPAELREDGLPIEFVAIDRDDVGSVCMIGPIIELLRVEATGTSRRPFTGPTLD